MQSVNILAHVRCARCRCARSFLWPLSLKTRSASPGGIHSQARSSIACALGGSTKRVQRGRGPLSLVAGTNRRVAVVRDGWVLHGAGEGWAPAQLEWFQWDHSDRASIRQRVRFAAGTTCSVSRARSCLGLGIVRKMARNIACPFQLHGGTHCARSPPMAALHQQACCSLGCNLAGLNLAMATPVSAGFVRTRLARPRLRFDSAAALPHRHACLVQHAPCADWSTASALCTVASVCQCLGAWHGTRAVHGLRQWPQCTACCCTRFAQWLPSASACCTVWLSAGTVQGIFSLPSPYHTIGAGLVGCVERQSGTDTDTDD